MFSPPSQAAFSYHQPHILKSLTVLCAGRNDINACRIDTAVAEYVGKFGNVLLDAVERAGKKMSQVMARPIASESWTDEIKEAARQRTLARKGETPCRK